jgi:hypothetical protein
MLKMAVIVQEMAAIKLDLVAIRTYHGGRYTVHARNDDHQTRDVVYHTRNVNLWR